jgi:hypothetical protein
LTTPSRRSRTRRAFLLTSECLSFAGKQLEDGRTLQTTTSRRSPRSTSCFGCVAVVLLVMDTVAVVLLVMDTVAVVLLVMDTMPAPIVFPSAKVTQTASYLASWVSKDNR